MYFFFFLNNKYTVFNFPRITKLHSFLFFRKTIMYSLCQVQMTLDFVDSLKKEVKWHGRAPDEAAHYCEECEVSSLTFKYMCVIVILA